SEEAPAVFERGDAGEQGLDLLRARLGHDQRRVGGVNHDEIVGAEHGDEVLALGEDDVVGTLLDDDGTARDVAGGVGREVAGGGRPGTHGGPAEGGGQADGAVGICEQRVIDGDFDELGVEFFQGRREGVAGGERGADCRQAGVERGGVGGEGFFDHGHAPDKHAGIPEVGAGLEVGLGDLELGFFNEALDGVNLAAGYFLPDGAALDVAEAGGGLGRRDADGDHHGRGRGGGEGGLEIGLIGLGVVDDVVGGQDGEHALRVARADDGGGQTDGGGGVAADGLNDDVGG